MIFHNAYHCQNFLAEICIITSEWLLDLDANIPYASVQTPLKVILLGPKCKYVGDRAERGKKIPELNAARCGTSPGHWIVMLCDNMFVHTM